MFWNVFYRLCTEKGTTPNAVAKIIGVSNATTTKWKNGAIPNGETLIKISKYFNVSTDYLLTGKENPPAVQQEEDEDILLLARKTKELPEEERKALIKLLNSTVETVLKAKGKL